MRTVSLRRRVAVWVLVLLVILLTALGFVVNYILGNALRDDLRQRLQDRASYAGVLQANGVSGQDLADELAGQGVFSSYLSGGDEYVGRESGRPGGPPGNRPTPRTPVAAPAVSFVEADSRMTVTVTFPNGTLTLSAGETEIERTLSELRRIELIAGGVTLLVAGLLLIRVVSLALRPLDRMTTLARHIRDGARGRRLRPTKPNTDLGRTAGAFDGMLDALESAEAQAKRAEEQMRTFLADASHDLRTPLAGVIAGAERLLRNSGDRVEREDRLVELVRQAQRASRLVDDLLLMTRLDQAERSWEPHELRRCPVRPADLISREVDALALRRPGVQVSVGLDSARDVQVVADSDQLQRAFGNVLDNAGKAAGPDGWITVSLSALGTMLELVVSDSGPGVPPEDAERIFDRFVRLSDSRSGSGSGLGLPISRSIVRAHGGDLWCAPSSSGAVFVLRLPCVVAAGPVSAQPAIGRALAL